VRSNSRSSCGGAPNFDEDLFELIEFCIAQLATQEKSTTTDRPATGDDVRFSGGYGSVTAVDGINRVHSVILGSWYLRQIKRQDKEAATEAASLMNRHLQWFPDPPQPSHDMVGTMQ
jgi:hypothetical protein